MTTAFFLPGTAQVDAKVDNGVLKVTIGKSADRGKARKVNITGGGGQQPPQSLPTGAAGGGAKKEQQSEGLDEAQPQQQTKKKM